MVMAFGDPHLVKKMEHMTEPELHKLMRLCAKAVEGAAKVSYVEQPLFALILFNDPKIGQYICNCERKEMIQALREMADRLEKNMDIPRSSTGDYNG